MEFKEFAQRPDAYTKICSMIGPSIYGHSDVKKAIACLLFGGSKKVFGLTQWLLCFWQFNYLFSGQFLVLP
jgi:DNA replicative helicase MCM subunit Mcm2 (Cdc46/Mcm family)